jgi:hypothetical protein
MKITIKVSEAYPKEWDRYTVSEYAFDVDNQAMMPYLIKGPRKNWGLMRNAVHPNMLFPVPENFVTGSLKVNGVGWFKEVVIDTDNISLVPCR